MNKMIKGYLMNVLKTNNRVIILVLTLLLPFLASSQHIGPFVSYSYKPGVKRMLTKLVKKNKKDGVYSRLTEVGDTLYYFERRENDSMLMKMAFNVDENYCDYQEISSNCGDCAVIRKYEIFRLFKWYKFSDTKYISVFNKRMTMELYKHPNSLYDKMIFRTNYMTRKEHRIARKSFDRIKK